MNVLRLVPVDSRPQQVNINFIIKQKIHNICHYDSCLALKGKAIIFYIKKLCVFYKFRVFLQVLSAANMLKVQKSFQVCKKKYPAFPIPSITVVVQEVF